MSQPHDREVSFVISVLLKTKLQNNLECHSTQKISQCARGLKESLCSQKKQHVVKTFA